MEGTAGRTAQDLSCQFLFVTGHLILWVCSMLCFVSGDCQWSLESSLHQGHKLILVFEVLYCHTFVMFSVSVVPFILCRKALREHKISLWHPFLACFVLHICLYGGVSIHLFVSHVCRSDSGVPVHVLYEFRPDPEPFRRVPLWNQGASCELFEDSYIFCSSGGDTTKVKTYSVRSSRFKQDTVGRKTIVVFPIDTLLNIH